MEGEFNGRGLATVAVKGLVLESKQASRSKTLERQQLTVRTNVSTAMTLDSTLRGLEHLATLALAVELEDLTRQQLKTGDELDLDTELSKSTVGVVATGAERLESVTVTVFAEIYV